MKYVLGADSPGYRQRLATLIGFFVTARLLREEPILGVFTASELCGAGLVSIPGATQPPGALDAVREEVWATLGADARARYDAFSRACQPLTVDVPHLHLNMLGIRPEYQGRGLGRELLAGVHALSRERADSEGVTLTTEDPNNVALYQHFGYRVVGHVRITPELESWGLFRPD
jgi:ribosomal protein S18 acetylase RimI-like enzyme